MLQPLSKPQFTTTIPAEMLQTFEVRIVGGGDKGTPFDPHPQTGYSPEDAILKLAMMLKTIGATPEDMLKQLPEGSQLMTLMMMKLRIETKIYLHFYRTHTGHNHDYILTKLKELYPLAPLNIADYKEEGVVEVALEEISGMTNFPNSGATGNTEPSPRKAAAKVYKVTTITQGGGDSEGMAKAMLTLKPEDIPHGGLVITMGKGGPKILKSASAITDEDEGAEYIHMNDDVVPKTAENPEEKPPRPKPLVVQAVVRDRSGLGGSVKSQDAKTPIPSRQAKVASKAKVTVLREVEMGIDTDEAGAMLDEQLAEELGEVAGGEEEEVEEVAKLMLGSDEDAATVADLVTAESHGEHQIQMPTGHIKRDRGGTRPPSSRER